MHRNRIFFMFVLQLCAALAARPVWAQRPSGMTAAAWNLLSSAYRAAHRSRRDAISRISMVDQICRSALPRERASSRSADLPPRTRREREARRQRAITALEALRFLHPGVPEVELRSVRGRDATFTVAEARALDAVMRNRVVGVDPTFATPRQPGETVDPVDKMFPSVCAVGTDTDFVCSGVLVQPKVVVTAAHCWGRSQVRPTRVYFGPEQPGPGATKPGLHGGEIIRVVAGWRHQEVVSGSQSDIAVLILADPPSSKYQPCKIADPVEILANFKTVVAGYGYDNGHRRGRLGYNAVPINGVCRAGQELCVPDLEMIATSLDRGNDTCNGDSGGPAYVFPGGDILLKPQVVGITARAVSQVSGECGSGGIYVLLKPHEPFFRAVARDFWTTKGTAQ